MSSNLIYLKVSYRVAYNDSGINEEFKRGLTTLKMIEAQQHINRQMFDRGTQPLLNFLFNAMLLAGCGSSAQKLIWNTKLFFIKTF